MATWKPILINGQPYIFPQGSFAAYVDYMVADAAGNVLRQGLLEIITETLTSTTHVIDDCDVRRPIDPDPLNPNYDTTQVLSQVRFKVMLSAQGTYLLYKSELDHTTVTFKVSKPYLLPNSTPTEIAGSISDEILIGCRGGTPEFCALQYQSYVITDAPIPNGYFNVTELRIPLANGSLEQFGTTLDANQLWPFSNKPYSYVRYDPETKTTDFFYTGYIDEPGDSYVINTYYVNSNNDYYTGGATLPLMGFRWRKVTLDSLNPDALVISATSWVTLTPQSLGSGNDRNDQYGYAADGDFANVLQAGNCPNGDNWNDINFILTRYVKGQSLVTKAEVVDHPEDEVIGWQRVKTEAAQAYPSIPTLSLVDQTLLSSGQFSFVSLDTNTGIITTSPPTASICDFGFSNDVDVFFLNLASPMNDGVYSYPVSSLGEYNLPSDMNWSPIRAFYPQYGIYPYPSYSPTTVNIPAPELYVFSVSEFVNITGTPYGRGLQSFVFDDAQYHSPSGLLQSYTFRTFTTTLNHTVPPIGSANDVYDYWIYRYTYDFDITEIYQTLYANGWSIHWSTTPDTRVSILNSDMYSEIMPDIDTGFSLVFDYNLVAPTGEAWLSISVENEDRSEYLEYLIKLSADDGDLSEIKSHTASGDRVTAAPMGTAYNGIHTTALTFCSEFAEVSTDGQEPVRLVDGPLPFTPTKIVMRIGGVSENYNSGASSTVMYNAHYQSTKPSYLLKYMSGYRV